ncbi:MAG TPA: hypothetical protein PLW37_03235 [bacterium]|nr:hypothetical protein [bacterium]HOG43441.1 hypothetical protein [bacterium]HPM45715.1 hypothetical protein [bacterium]HPV20407.1 hypothetical protein [bacterium]HPY13811.1 hypothetical protein [bacterium]
MKNTGALVFKCCIFLSALFFSCENELSQIEFDHSAKWKMVSPGGNHVCAIDENDELYCWGSNLGGQLGDGTEKESLRPKKVNDYKWSEVSAGELFTCGIRVDGDLFCWGTNYYGETGTGSDKEFINKPSKVGNMKWKKVKLVNMLMKTACALSFEDELYCWGRNYPVTFGDISGESANVPQKAGDYKWKDFAIGTFGGCGINLENELFCWGQGQYPVVDPESETRDIPNKIGNEKWNEISVFSFVHSDQTCAIRSDSTLFCWGTGTGIFSGLDSMKEISSGWVDVSVGQYDVCGVKTDGFLYCFGKNMNGLFFGGGRDYAEEPVRIDSGKWKTVKSGLTYKCAISEDEGLYCWGYNDLGQIGNGKKGNLEYPDKIDDEEWELISSGYSNNCGIKDGKIYCWGNNSTGQLGDGTYNDRQMPVKTGNKNWKTVSAKGSATFAIDGDNKLYFWGNSYENYVSDIFEQKNYTEPVIVDDGSWRQISTGHNHTCGIRSDNHLYCWGYNGDGQLGFETFYYNGEYGKDKPEKVNDEEWMSVYAGDSQTCALNKENLLFCWGHSHYGCDSYEPNFLIRQVSYMKWKKIDLMRDTYCGITEEDDLYCWGDNGAGQVGIGEINSSVICEPAKVGNRKWKEVSTGFSGVCGIDSEDDLYCWGQNRYGFLGIEVVNDKYYSEIPVKVGRKKWKSVSLGYESVCALDDSGKPYCWGNNFTGALGNNLAWVEEKFRVLR